MRKWLPAIGIAAVAGALTILFFGNHAREGVVTPVAQAPADTRALPAVSAIPSRGASAAAASNAASEKGIEATTATNAARVAAGEAVEAIPGSPEFTNVAPAAVMDHMRNTIHLYASMFGGNPVGTNPEITAALNGDNPKGANFIKPEDGMRINAKGELVDPWGTPFFFHQISGTEMEIHSAGPDRVMWTADDLVVK
jgi:hypothetical protein